MSKRMMKALTITAVAGFAGLALGESVAVDASRIDTLREVAAENPTDASVRARLGALLIQSGQADEGRQWMNEALALDPSLGERMNVSGELEQAPRHKASFRGFVPGQDVYVCDLPNISNYGSQAGFHAYAVGTTSANRGDTDLIWLDNSTQHPVIGQNLYRLNDGIFEHIGQSWLKHGFCALQQDLCDNCTNGSFGCLSELSPGCSDPYTSSLNGQQNLLGPKSEVNPTTGVFQWPHSTPQATEGFTVAGRVQVPSDLLIPNSTDDDVRYWVEGQYIHPQDSHTSSNHSENNASYRPVTIANNSSRSMGLIFSEPTRQFEPAVFGWKEEVPSVEIQRFQVVDGDGYFFLAYNVTDNGDGTWLYQYNLFNLDSNNGVDELSVEAPSGVTVSDIEFYKPRWHSGEIYSNDDWVASRNADDVSWVVPTRGAADARVRWNTMHSYRFTADSAPVEGELVVNSPGSGTAALTVMVPEGTACPTDFNGDGVTDSNDLGQLIAGWGGASADLTGDSVVNANDLGVLIAAWGPCD